MVSFKWWFFMWLEPEKYRQIDRVVCRGEKRGLSRILFEFFHPENQKQLKNPSVCPKCQKPLERKMLPYLEYFIHACPDQHGAWITPEVSAKIRDMMSQQMYIATRRAQSLRFLAWFGLTLLVTVLLSDMPAWMKRFQETYETSKIGESFWPQRSFDAFPPFSSKASGIQNEEEAAYFSQLVPILEEGASNRLNMEAVLKTRRSEDQYWAVFQIYQKRQQEMLSVLRSVHVPGKLQTFHERLLRAGDSQITFYASFLQEKIKNASVTLNDMLSHAALRTCNRELLQAYDDFLKLYPDVNPQFQQALESRLCWFDIV